MAKIRAEGVEYDVPNPATLGELRDIKRHYGVIPADFERPSDPDVICGLLFVAMKRAKALPSDEATVAAIDALTRVDFIAGAEDEPDPTPAADDGGNQATTPEDSGPEPSSTTTD